MTKYKWTDGMFLEPGGHRIFREDRGGFAAPETLRWAIADNSGPRPDTTDDGVLWLDFSRPLRVGMDSCEIPSLVERDGLRETHCPCGVGAIATLREKFPRWALLPTRSVSDLLKLFALDVREEPPESPASK